MFSLMSFVSVVFATIIILIIIALVSGQSYSTGYRPDLGPYDQHGGRGYVPGPYYEHGGRITHDGRLY
jgi:hypothetical protein